MPDICAALQEQVKAASEQRTPLEIRGGGSKRFLGRQVDTEGSQTLEVGGHSGICSYEPVELVLTVRAGTPLAEIEAALGENGQMLAFDPPRFSPQSTIGGTLACNLSGPGRPWHGSVRDHVLGVQLINGRGELLRFGGQVMKNVAGYDVSRLQAGAMGTLGVLSQISLKVMPKPAAVATVSAPMSADEAIEYMNATAGEGKPLAAATWLDNVLYLRLAGTASAVEASVKQWGLERLDSPEQFWQQLRDQQLDWFEHAQPLWRFSVAPNSKQSVFRSLDGSWLFDWSGAQRWYRGHGELSAMQGLAAHAGGEAALFRRASGSVDAPASEVFHQPVPALQRIQRNLKASFDPEDIFNRGRLYGWLSPGEHVDSVLQPGAAVTQ